MKVDIFEVDLRLWLATKLDPEPEFPNDYGRCQRSAGGLWLREGDSASKMLGHIVVPARLDGVFSMAVWKLMNLRHFHLQVQDSEEDGPCQATAVCMGPAYIRYHREPHIAVCMASAAALGKKVREVG